MYNSHRYHVHISTSRPLHSHSGDSLGFTATRKQINYHRLLTLILYYGLDLHHCVDYLLVGFFFKL